MNYLDIFVVVLLGWGAFKGFKKGLVIEVTTLIALGLGVYGGVNFSHYVSPYLDEVMQGNETYTPLVAFGITFLGIVVAVYFIGKLLEKFIDLIALSFVNKLAGASFGVAKITLILCAILLLVNSYDNQLHFIPESLKEDSLLYEPLSNLSEQILPALEKAEQEIPTSGDTVVQLN